MHIAKNVLSWSAIFVFLGCASGYHNDAVESSVRTPAQAASEATVTLFGKGTIRGPSTDYKSPNNKLEQCIPLNRFPASAAAKYKKSDEEQESKLCGMDFYNDKSIALCPKETSTSPGTMIYKKDENISNEDWAAKACASHGEQDAEKEGTLAKFKNTMNAGGARGTSGTFSISSLLYYHFSRYFDSNAVVPVSVFRTIDRSEHYKVVSEHGHGGGMLGNGWFHMQQIEVNPSADVADAQAMLLPDASEPGGYGNVFGIMLKKSALGRAGAEINGDRQDAWGVEQNRDLLYTVGFAALRSASPLDQAIKDGEAYARKDHVQSPYDDGTIGPQNTKPVNHSAKVMNAALGNSPMDPFQVVSWMKSQSDIAILDIIFAQQDRIGNIDYGFEAYYNGPKMNKTCEVQEDGPVASDEINHLDIKLKVRDVASPYATYLAAAKSASTKSCLKSQKEIRVIEQAHINDNDAGGLSRYADYFDDKVIKNKSGQVVRVDVDLLGHLHHFNAHSYTQLMRLDKDFQSKGEIYKYFSTTFGLSSSQVQYLVQNTNDLAKNLRSQCSAIAFDVEPVNYLKAKLASGEYKFPANADVCGQEAQGKFIF